jgi:hypothetical protein
MSRWGLFEGVEDDGNVARRHGLIGCLALASEAWALGEPRSSPTTRLSTSATSGGTRSWTASATEEATARLFESFDDYLGEDEDTEKLFWMALAAAQFDTGRLLPDIGQVGVSWRRP